MQMQMQERDGWVVMTPAVAELTQDVAADFKARIFTAITGGARLLIVDLAHVRFIDSAGLGCLVVALRQLPPDGDFRVCGLHPSVRAMFELTRLHRVLGLYRDVDEAVADVAPGGAESLKNAS